MDKDDYRKLYVLDADGCPVPEPDIARWGQWFGTHNRSIAENIIGVGDVRISTVFLAIDHSFAYLTGGDGPPILYETMVFGGPLDGEMDRYITREAALPGHAAMVERVKAALH
jgi:hypothetical protein